MDDRPAPAHAGGEIPPWRVGVASAVIAAVAFGVVAGAVWRGLHAEPAARAVSHAAPPAPSSPPGEHEAVTASVRAALDAWEAFARSGDLDDVAGAFIVGGPQHRRFRWEARSGRAGVERAPTLSLRSVTAVDAVGARREAVTRVAVTTEGDPPDVRDWVFVLEGAAGSWRVWTVVDRSG